MDACLSHGRAGKSHGNGQGDAILLQGLGGMIILNNNVKRYALDWYINVGGQKSHSVYNLQLKLLISMSDTLWKRPVKGSVQFMRSHGRHQVQPSKEEGKKGMPGAEPAYRPRTLSSGPETQAPWRTLWFSESPTH